MQVLMSEMVILGAQAGDRADAIRQAGAVLVGAGCAAPAYIDGMLAREQIQSTYLGSGIAIPHGDQESLRFVYQTGVSVLLLPEGVEWEPGERAFLVVGLASTDLQHSWVLTSLVDLLQSPEEIPALIHAADPVVVVERLTRGRSENVWN